MYILNFFYMYILNYSNSHFFFTLPRAMYGWIGGYSCRIVLKKISRISRIRRDRSN